MNKGRVTIEIWKIEAAEFIGACTQNDICLTNVKPTSKGFTVTVEANKARAILNIVRQKHARAKILRKEGAVFKLHRFKKRNGIFLGTAVVLAILQLMVSYIWNYDISGNDRYSDTEMIAILEQYGAKKGTPISDIDTNMISEKVLSDYNGKIAWMWLGVRGTVLEVRVKEMERTPLEYTDTADIIAADDGVVTEILVLEGEALVQKGDRVKKGDVLIRGVEYDNWQKNEEGIYVPADEGRRIRARGSIKGLGEHVRYVAASLNEHYFTENGARQEYYRVCKNEKEILASNHPKIAAESVLWQKNLRLGREVWSVEKVASTPLALNVCSYTPEQAYVKCTERAESAVQFAAEDIIASEMRLLDAKNAGVVLVENKLLVKEDLGEIVYR